MKRLIRWALNHLPRTFLQRIAGISVPVLGWFYIGRGVECPVCAPGGASSCPTATSTPVRTPSAPAASRSNGTACYGSTCNAKPTCRPRTASCTSAPEVCLMRKLRKHYDGHPGLYLTADLESPLADMHFDVRDIPSRTILRTW